MMDETVMVELTIPPFSMEMIEEYEVYRIDFPSDCSYYGRYFHIPAAAVTNVNDAAFRVRLPRSHSITLLNDCNGSYSEVRWEVLALQITLYIRENV